MNIPMKANRDYWRAMLGAGGFTTIPRWTRDPVAGVADLEAKLGDELVTALRALAGEMGVPLGSILLAAHAKALAAVSGERDVTTAYLAIAGRQPLPCLMSTEPQSWRALAQSVHRAVSDLVAHADLAVDDLRRELGLTGPLSEAVFDPAGGTTGLGDGQVLAIVVVEDAGAVALRIVYRTDAIDAASAGRILGYHIAALGLMAADPDAAHGPQSLLSRDEIQFQVEGLAGPRRDLPDSRVHEIFEDWAKAQPDAIAAAIGGGGRHLTYRELNTRANRLARALLVRGLRPEDVVAVVTERNLNWIVAVLAIFKAGGAYLPIEPRFPAERIAKTLARAECVMALTENGSETTLDQALKSLPATGKLHIEDALNEDHAIHDLGIDVSPDQLAYIYFTSGSTGEPKGAMCEQAGMLNHMLAKIDDLEISDDAVVAQVAPQCFDISLWQLLAALLVGGRTLIVEQAAILDVERFVDVIARAGVTTLQVVPSYLEVVLTFLGQERSDLPSLRCVSVTGEALTVELARRWFAAAPRIKLVNAYGLTETSDDTNHEVMDRAPDRDRISLGLPIGNVHVYLVDEHLSPVPLGAPGEIVFSGVCVGRGYVNDPDRTQQSFVPDPIRPGERLYRSGDYGCWRPDGKLEFLGRRDAQVKIRGFRVELGEIENKLLEVAGVNHCAVVVAEGADRSKHLVAFHSGAQVEPEALDSALRQVLPAYMVPTAFHWRDSLPLTANGKTDKKALVALVKDLNVASVAVDAPVGAAEERLAGAWADVLGIPRDAIGRHDNFFERGGTSLSAAKLVIALGRAVSLKQVILHPVLSDLARLVADRSGSQMLARIMAQSRDVAAGRVQPERRDPPAVPTENSELVQ